MKRTMVITLAVLMLAVCLFSCQSSPAPSASLNPTPSSGSDTTPETSSTPDEPETPDVSGKITVSTWDLVTSNAYLETMAVEFNKLYPEVEIEFIDIPSADYTSKLNVDLNGGAGADMIMIKDADTTYALNQKGQLADLSPLIARDGVDLGIYNGLDKYFGMDGKQVGLPFRTDYYILYYNKGIFDAADEPYPSNDMTWTEFEALAKKLTKGSGSDKVYGAHFHTWQACVENWAVQGGKGTIMGPDYSFFKPYYEMVLRMQNDDKSIQDFATLKTANIHYSNAFYTGNVAMMPMGTWFMSSVIGKINAGEANIDWGIATIPHASGEKAGETVGATTPMAINAASKNQEAAWAFLKFCTGAEGAQILAESGAFPGCVNDQLLATITSAEGVPEGAADALKVDNIVLDRPYVPFVNEVNQMLGEEHSLVMLGETTLDDFIATITERSAEIQAE